jgi:hypothetical protein
MLERQARRALDAALDPGETVRGFTVCEYDNGTVTLQAFARLAVSKGFFAVTDKRVFLIPTRVRDIVGFPFAAVEEVRLPLDDLPTIGLGGGQHLGMTLADPAVGRVLMARWKAHIAAGQELFDLVFRTEDFEQRMAEEMAKQLARGLPHDQAVREVGMGVYRIVLGYAGNKAVASAGAFAAEEIARRHPAADAAGEPVGP